MERRMWCGAVRLRNLTLPLSHLCSRGSSRCEICETDPVSIDTTRDACSALLMPVCYVPTYVPSLPLNSVRKYVRTEIGYLMSSD